MSAKYPIISVTGSSGAGTTSVRRTFEQIFRRERIAAVFIEGDAFHRYNRDEMQAVMAEEELKGNRNFSHFGANANLLEELEAVFCSYSESGIGKTRHYVHDDEEAANYGCAPETFTDWEALPEKSDLLFYEGLHGAVKTDKVNISQYPDLKIGVVPVINLEWIQKIHRDCSARGYTVEEVMDTMLRRMPDYIRYMCRACAVLRPARSKMMQRIDCLTASVTSMAVLTIRRRTKSLIESSRGSNRHVTRAATGSSISRRHQHHSRRSVAILVNRVSLARRTGRGVA